MLVYWAIFLILAAGALMNQQGDRRSGLAFLVLASIPTALMIGLRRRIGPDWGAYIQIYDQSHLESLMRSLDHSDPAFYLLNWSLAQVGAPFLILTSICAFIFVSGLTAFCLRQTNPWLAYLVAFPYLVIVVAMSGMRQSVAIGLLCFALNAYERNHFGRSMLIIMAAALFHASAIVMAPLCALSYSRNRLFSLIVLATVVALTGMLLAGSFGQYAARYSLERLQSSGIWFRLAMNGLPALIFLRWQRLFGLEQAQRILWRNQSLASLAFVPIAMLVPSNTAIDRLILYLFPLQFFVLSRLPTIFARDHRRKGILTLQVVAYMGLAQLIFLQFAKYRTFYVPYHSMLESNQTIRGPKDRIAR